MLISGETASLLVGGMLVAYIAVALIGIWCGVQNFRREEFGPKAWYPTLGCWAVMLGLKLSMEYVEEHRALEPELADVTPAPIPTTTAPAECCTCAFVEQEGMTYDIAPRRER